MNVLWFTNTFSLYGSGTHNYNGGGWIESLEKLVAGKIGLAISFLHPTDNKKTVQNGVTYYPILKKRRNGFSKVIHNWSGNIDGDIYTQQFVSVINEFKPDVVHIFGTEGPFAKVQTLVKCPVIIHLQGLVNPYVNAYYPPGFNGKDILMGRRFWKNNLLGNSLVFDKRRFQKQAQRELGYFNQATFLMGRTGWDKQVAGLLAPRARYFHVDEVLRSIFYERGAWEAGTNNKGDKKIVLLSTISETIYKGLDVIIKAAKLLKDNGSMTFEWRIIGIGKGHRFTGFLEDKLGIGTHENGVRFLGKKNAEELVAEMQAADIFIHPSYIDNSPNSLCEAQMLGLPVIVCNVGGVSSLVSHNHTGVLIPANAPYELAASILSFSTTNKTEAICMARQGRAAAFKRHDRETIVKQLLDVYNEVIAQ